MIADGRFRNFVTGGTNIARNRSTSDRVRRSVGPRPASTTDCKVSALRGGRHEMRCNPDMRAIRCIRRIATMAALAFVVAVMPAIAQETTGTLKGRIVDAQGLAVPGVTVTATG